MLQTTPGMNHAEAMSSIPSQTMCDSASRYDMRSWAELCSSLGLPTDFVNSACSLCPSALPQNYLVLMLGPNAVVSSMLPTSLTGLNTYNVYNLILG